MTETRRSFLKQGLVGGALLALGAAGIGLWPSRRVTPRRALVALDALELSVVAALAETICPGCDPIEVGHRVDDYLAAASAAPLRDLRRLLRLVESGLVGLVLDGRPRPFTRLPVEARARALEAMRDSRLPLRRGGYAILRRLIVSARWSDPAAWATLGYAGPPQLTRPT